MVRTNVGSNVGFKILALLTCNKRRGMKNIKAFIDLIDDNMCPINEEIKDDREALEIWSKMSKLQNTLEDFLEEEEKRQDQERIAEQKKNIQRVDAQVKGVKW
jgi:hypothetical protein